MLIRKWVIPRSGTAIRRDPPILHLPDQARYSDHVRLCSGIYAYIDKNTGEQYEFLLKMSSTGPSLFTDDTPRIRITV